MLFGSRFSVWVVLSFALLSHSYRYDPAYVEYNINTNKAATEVLDYSTDEKSSFHPSPASWRFPFYTLFLDRFVNGDPTNDNINGTSFETDHSSNQIRHGGDIAGLVQTLDYLHGMGIRVCRYSLIWSFANMSHRDCTLPGLPSSMPHPGMINTLPSISRSWTLTSEPSRPGAMQSTRYTRVACTSFWTTLLQLWVT